MGSGLGNRVVAGFLAVVVCAGMGIIRLGGAPAAAGASDCASLGQAANFAVFSDGEFNASESSGTSVTGRIAAAGNVTLDGVSINPAAGDSSPTIVAGGNFTGGRTTGAGGTVNGGVTYGGTANVAQNFTVNGGLTNAAPPFSFDTQFTSLKTLSASLADLPQSPGASVSLAFGALTLTGTGIGLNVFTVDASQLAQAAGIVLNLTQPGATALINVTTDTILSIAPMYMNLSGSATAAGTMWNFPLATALNVTHGVAWQGTILAPNAAVTGLNHPQLNGQLLAASVPDSSWVINRVTYSGCLPAPPAPPDHTLSLAPLCIDYNGDLDMRMRNTGDQTRSVTWRDLTGRDFGQFDIPPHSDFFFYDRGGSGSSVVSATSGTTTVRTNGTDARWQGRSRTRILVAAALRSIVVVSSDTPDTNTANNAAQANVTTFSDATVHAHISAPPFGRVATQLTYQVSATLGKSSPAGPVRLCTQPPRSFVQVHAPGTFKHRGVFCIDYALVRPGRSVSFVVHGFPSATGRLTPVARATAVGAPRESRVSAAIDVFGPLACPAAKRPTGHAAC